MVKKIILLIGLCFLYAASLEHTAIAAKTKPLEIGAKAPDFSLRNLKGETLKLSDFKGKKVMLNFWATWCPPCKQEMPAIQQFFEEKGKDVVILAVNIDGSEDVIEFVQSKKITFPILLDENNRVNEQYKVVTIPTTFFIDEKGIIQHKFYSAMPIEIMREFSK
ncbi:peroxiredoxin family protein [Niallia nealsonii]|uniref:Alkyl hydroperoxide reductase n=1 Tax=Niallia nealsonii TaxID=115979 RepID=A0A2N0YYT7_9BACI|nr:TlpA disulfide reductase family protein [Niallia nealsonii]PKG22405.1 alkyl hydroperoxide reductase [Niallia nealsonii]